MKMDASYRWLMSRLFSGMFQIISLLLVGIAVYRLTGDFIQGKEVSGIKEVMSIIVHCINNLIVALAMFELSVGIRKEYSSPEEETNLFNAVSRTITRFVATVCIALVLEALMMIIEYSQLDLAGNLVYPIAIIVATSFLLIALGVFLKLVKGYVTEP